MNPRVVIGLVGVSLLAVSLAALLFVVTQLDTTAPEPRNAPAATEPIPVAPRKPVVFRRPVPVAPASEPSPPAPEPLAAPQTLEDLPHAERALLQRAARIALGQTLDACEADVPEGLLAIAIVTLDADGLLELAAIEGAGEPLDAPALEACLDDTLWSHDWPATSGPPVRFGLQLQGPAPLD